MKIELQLNRAGHGVGLVDEDLKPESHQQWMTTFIMPRDIKADIWTRTDTLEVFAIYLTGLTKKTVQDTIDDYKKSPIKLWETLMAGPNIQNCIEQAKNMTNGRNNDRS